MGETVDVERDGRGVATLRLTRAEKHNALSRTMIDELSEAAEELGRDAGVRVVVLAAEGRSFCAGGDLGWMREQMTADADGRAAEARRLALMLRALDRLPKPLIGRVHGNAFGGGVGLISVCDAAIAAEGARFGLTETRLGLIPATIGPYVAARLGPAARRVFYSPRLFGAEEAAAMGLVARVVPPDALDAAMEAEVVPYLDAAPGAVAEAKTLLHRLRPVAEDATLDLTADALDARWQTDEARRGIAAFFDKRPAPWAGG